MELRVYNGRSMRGKEGGSRDLGIPGSIENESHCFHDKEIKLLS